MNILRKLKSVMRNRNSAKRFGNTLTASKVTKGSPGFQIVEGSHTSKWA
jgi:hypothetical protein